MHICFYFINVNVMLAFAFSLSITYLCVVELNLQELTYSLRNRDTHFYADIRLTYVYT